MADNHLLNATGIHICTTRSRSGIASYAKDFHRLVLEPEGYVLADPDAVRLAHGAFARDVRFHIQLGVFQHCERLAMTDLMDRGYRAIDATIHDPPFLTFPYFQFRSKLVMRLSRGFDWYLGSLGLQRRGLESLSRVFVLSEAGRRSVLRLAPRANVVTIPHIVPDNSVWPTQTTLGPALLYFGFIGPGKGLEYALKLHRALLRIRPHTHLHIVGQISGNTAQRFLAKLKAEYREDVTFHGYVPDDQLDALFETAAHVILPYADYRYIVPASGSVIHALRRARIVWTTDVNAMSEIIHDGENGFMLAMDVNADANRLAAVIEDVSLSRRISDGARRSALKMANYPYRGHFATAR